MLEIKVHIACPEKIFEGFMAIASRGIIPFDKRGESTTKIIALKIIN